MMGSLFRSEEMALCQLFVQTEAAYSCVSEIGELGKVQFRDLNPNVNNFQRNFINEVRRCDEMERKLRYIEKQIKKDGIPMVDCGEDHEAPLPREMVDLEVTFEKMETELKEVNMNADTLKKNYLELTELKHILRKTQMFFDEQGSSPTSTESISKALMNEDGTKNVSPSGCPIQLGFIGGVILRDRIYAFERMLWRACRGNVFLRMTEIETPLEDPTTGSEVNKSVFIIFFQGDQLKTKVKKICEGFRATLYPCPEQPADRREMAMGVMTRIEDLNRVLGQTQDHRQRVLAAAAKNIKIWFLKVRKIKAIYHTLNLFSLNVTQKCLIAECWIPVLDIETVKLALRRGTERAGGSFLPILDRMDTSEDPPTYNRTNKFTSGFQNLVNAYGVASYREMNPAPYTVITFPFLFGVMFGDMGHGLIMTAFAAWMVIREKQLLVQKSDNEVWNIFFGGRYIILLMGLFSMYTGFIYNDIFSKSINIFHSSWSSNYNSSTILHNGFLTLDPATDDYTGDPYPAGMDPIWQLADNKIAFLNGYKMKISIIFGVIHMLFGVIIGLKNYTYFNSKLDIFTMFIPQIIFLCFIFLYLVILMFVKWFLYSPKATDVDWQPYCAPSILITFINMVLLKANEGLPLPDNKTCPPYMYSNQDLVQKVLLGIAVICIPWMLLCKPLYLMFNKKKEHQLLRNQDDIADGETASANHHEEEEPLSELFIHQGIHTIEYVLGSVSHTASYLRLWALSLAHAQLSEVLWGMVLSKGLVVTGYVGSIMIWAIFAFWAVLTISILVLMEGLSAFLHTLRLHWVEFQSKFYEGQGYEFQPFSFKVILALANASDD